MESEKSQFFQSFSMRRKLKTVFSTMIPRKVCKRKMITLLSSDSPQSAKFTMIHCCDDSRTESILARKIIWGKISCKKLAKKLPKLHESKSEGNQLWRQLEFEVDSRFKRWDAFFWKYQPVTDVRICETFLNKKIFWSTFVGYDSSQSFQ